MELDSDVGEFRLVSFVTRNHKCQLLVTVIRSLASVPGKSEEPQTSVGSSSREADWYDEYTGKTFPHTVALLPSPEGAQVYLIGTIHFSTQSCDDVSQVFTAILDNFIFCHFLLYCIS